MFTTTNDQFGPYYLFAPKHTFVRNVTNAKGGGVISFLDCVLRVPRVLRDDTFATELINSKRDEIIISFFSVLIIFLIQSLVASFLLTTHDGKVWSFGFYVNQFIDLVRDYRFNHIRTRFTFSRRRRYGLKVALTAILIFAFAFSTQTLVLWLSARGAYTVTNAEKSFVLVQPLSPDWNAVRNSSLFLINKPCLSVVIINVGRGSSRINNCLTSNLSANAFERYEVVTDDAAVSATIVSDLHVYGADHTLTIDGASVQYVARSYFALDDFETRIMKQRSRINKQERQMSIVHKQFFAYLFTSYVRMSGDTAMNLERLRSLKFESMKITNGSVVSIVQTSNGSSIFRTASLRYETRVQGVMPRGTAAFRFAQSFFKGIIGIEVGPADESDLIANTGVQILNGVMWGERRRYLNTVSVLLTVVGMGAALVLVRLYLQPMDMASMALAALQQTEEMGEALAVETEAVVDDGVKEVGGMEDGMGGADQQRAVRAFRLGAGSNQRSYLAKEYNFGKEGRGR